MENQTLHYEIGAENPLSHFVQFKLTITGITAPETKLLLPTWRPGRYQIQNFSQNIYQFSPQTLAGEKLPYHKPSKDCWVIENGDSSSIEVHYTFLARQFDAGGSWSDENQLYLNFITCAFQVEGRRDSSYSIALQVPEHFEIATPLPKKGDAYWADTFDELVETPLIASNQLQVKSFKHEGSEFFIWINGQVEPDWEQIITDFQKFTEQQYLVFGGFPHATYHYLFQITPFKSYHGVEHHRSTVITLGSDYQFAERAFYRNLMGIASHELFHVWNVKAIRPEMLLPYDYQQESYFDTGWVLEGVTTYYGDLMMVKGGATTLEEYLEELSKDAQRHFDNEGRQHQSLCESSIDLWVDGYSRNLPKRSVSIYVKGSLVALLLDLTLRLESSHHISLDTLTKALWERFGKTGKGYTQAAIEALLQELTQKDWTTFFDRFLRGTERLEQALEEAFAPFGLQLRFSEQESPLAAHFGVIVSFKDGVATVQRLAEGSPGFQTLSTGDEIIAINRRKVTSAPKEFDWYFRQNTVRFSLFRQGVLTEATMERQEGNTFFNKVTISKVENPTLDQETNLGRWMNWKDW